MKTILIYQKIPESLEFIVMDGDLTRFEGVYINAYTVNKAKNRLQDELCDLLYDKDNGSNLYKAQKEFPYKEVNEGAKVIVCGFML